MEINSDLHCHPSLKASNSDKPASEIWNHQPASPAINKLNKQIRKAIESLARGTQAHLDACIEGKTRLLFTSIYPFERPFLQVCPQKPFRLLFKLILPEKKYNLLGEAALGVPASKIEEMIAEAQSPTGVNYFEELNKELRFLVDAQQTTSSNSQYAQHRFHLANDFDHMKDLLADEKNIVGILTIEGAHAIGAYAFSNPFNYTFDQLNSDQKSNLTTAFEKNIKTLKSNAEPGSVPLFVTFSHHFNNLLAGHATSLSDKKLLTNVIKKFYTPGMRHLFDQKPNLEQGFSELGIKVVKWLLDRSNGRRILIDTKHMSSKSRKEFYAMLNTDYANDPIPVINSHAAVNGIRTLAEAIPLASDRNLGEGSFFSRWTINMTDEDIEQTFARDGLIGLCLHEGRMPGDKFMVLKKGKTEPEIQDLYLKLFWSNAFHIARIQKSFKEANQMQDVDHWRGIMVGSDYDGIVDPFDDYHSMKDYPELRSEMIDYLTQKKEIIDVYTESPMNQASVDDILNGKQPAELVDEMFYTNARLFLSKYFTSDYLESDI
ncbi:MAG: hypothetical protein AAFX87_10420 [Bacteroidota bacterium]